MTDTARAASDELETILLVLDDVTVRMTISEYLRHCGYKVIEAANADEALTVLNDRKIKVDIAFIDLHIPGPTNGFALSTWLRRNRPDIDVILAGTVKRAAEAAAEVCEDGPLPKPYEPQTLVNRIKQMRAAHQRRR